MQCDDDYPSSGNAINGERRAKRGAEQARQQCGADADRERQGDDAGEPLRSEDRP